MYLVEEFHEDGHCEFVPWRGFFLGYIAYVVVHKGDKVLQLSQVHLTKCANAQ